MFQSRSKPAAGRPDDGQGRDRAADGGGSGQPDRHRHPLGRHDVFLRFAAGLAVAVRGRPARGRWRGAPGAAEAPIVRSGAGGRNFRLQGEVPLGCG